MKSYSKTTRKRHILKNSWKHEKLWKALQEHKRNKREGKYKING